MKQRRCKFHIYSVFFDGSLLRKTMLYIPMLLGNSLENSMIGTVTAIFKLAVNNLREKRQYRFGKQCLMVAKQPPNLVLLNLDVLQICAVDVAAFIRAAGDWVYVVADIAEQPRTLFHAVMLNDYHAPVNRLFE